VGARTGNSSKSMKDRCKFHARKSYAKNTNNRQVGVYDSLLGGSGGWGGSEKLAKLFDTSNFTRSPPRRGAADVFGSIFVPRARKGRLCLISLTFWCDSKKQCFFDQPRIDLESLKIGPLGSRGTSRDASTVNTILSWFAFVTAPPWGHGIVSGDTRENLKLNAAEWKKHQYVVCFWDACADRLRKLLGRDAPNCLCNCLPFGVWAACEHEQTTRALLDKNYNLQQPGVRNKGGRGHSTLGSISKGGAEATPAASSTTPPAKEDDYPRLHGGRGIATREKTPISQSAEATRLQSTTTQAKRKQSGEADETGQPPKRTRAIAGNSGGSLCAAGPRRMDSGFRRLKVPPTRRLGRVRSQPSVKAKPLARTAHNAALATENRGPAHDDETIEAGASTQRKRKTIVQPASNPSMPSVDVTAGSDNPATVASASASRTSSGLKMTGVMTGVAPSEWKVQSNTPSG
jgi:hypothetical protein